MTTAQQLAEELRNACDAVRRKPFPISDLVHLMQRAADALATQAWQQPTPTLARERLKAAIDALDDGDIPAAVAILRAALAAQAGQQTLAGIESELFIQPCATCPMPGLCKTTEKCK